MRSRRSAPDSKSGKGGHCSSASGGQSGDASTTSTGHRPMAASGFGTRLRIVEHALVVAARANASTHRKRKVDCVCIFGKRFFDL